MVRDSSEVRPLRDGNGVGRPGFCCAAKGVFDLGIGHDRFLDLTGRTSLHELCEVIAGCAAYRPWNKCSTRQRPFSATRR